ncbi:MAG: ATP-binding protein, partial [Mycoplasmataceae bacterium]|nr:ATP-binding protein [Mycoplasmataceae bacterium]
MKKKYIENKTNKKQNGNELILSHNNKTGGVILLIGPNNSGKSNILDALEFSTINSEEKNPPQRTYYNLGYQSTQSEKSTKIKFSSPDWFHTEEEKKQNPTTIFIDYFNDGDLFSVSEISKSSIFQDIFWNKIVNNKYYKKSWKKEKKEIFGILSEEKKLSEYLATIIFIYINILLEADGDSEIKISEINENIADCLVEEFKKGSESHINYYLKNGSWISNVIKLSQESSVVRYDEKDDEIKNVDLDLNFLKLNKFGENFFSIIDAGLELKNKYIGVYNNQELPENMKIQNYESIINNINKKLMSVSKKFNELYFSSSESYVFELKRKETYTSYLLCLSVQDEKDGNVPINLDSQSWGFKWFFNFFFNVFSNRELYAGTIVLIEEPAVNLHVEGQIKWIEFVREFAVKNKITFVI